MVNLDEHARATFKARFVLECFRSLDVAAVDPESWGQPWVLHIWRTHARRYTAVMAKRVLQRVTCVYVYKYIIITFIILRVHRRTSCTAGERRARRRRWGTRVYLSDGLHSRRRNRFRFCQWHRFYVNGRTYTHAAYARVLACGRCQNLTHTHTRSAAIVVFFFLYLKFTEPYHLVKSLW